MRKGLATQPLSLTQTRCARLTRWSCWHAVLRGFVIERRFRERRRTQFEAGFCLPVRTRQRKTLRRTWPRVETGVSWSRRVRAFEEWGTAISRLGVRRKKRCRAGSRALLVGMLGGLGLVFFGAAAGAGRRRRAFQ